MSNSKMKRSLYKEINFDQIKFIENGKLVDLKGRQNTLEVELGNLGLVYEIEDNER